MKQITESNLRLIYNLQGDVSSFLSHILNDENYSQDDYDRIFYFIDSYYKKKYEYEKNGTFRLYSPSDYFMRDIFEVLKDFDKGQYMNLLNTYRGTGIFPAKIIRHIANNYAVLTRALIGLLYCYHIFDIDIDDKSIYTSFSNDEELLKQLAGCFVLIAQEQYYQSKSSGKIGTGEDQMSVTSSPSSPTSITKGENTNLFNCTQLPISPDILQLGKEIENVSSTGKGTFIVMSDFHGTFWPIDKIRDYYVNEYDKIYILGDSTDRGIDDCGKGSVKMLLAIKELVDKYPNKIVYLAGNHDDFLYKYMCDKNSKYKDYAKNSLSRNGQTTTMQEFDYLRQSNPTLFNELRDWLGNRPLQSVHEYDGKTYYLAYALFNQTLYNENPTLSLKDYYESSGEKTKKILKTLWYRDQNAHLFSYDSEDMPRGGYNNIMVVGHTPGRESFKVSNDIGEKVQAYVVDSGVFDPRSTDMLKFCNGVVETTSMSFHNPPYVKIKK